MELFIYILAMFIGFHAIYFYITKFSGGLIGILFVLGMAIGLHFYLDYLNVRENVSRLTFTMFGAFLFSIEMIYNKIMLEIKKSNVQKTVRVYDKEQ
ncbi:membrane protein [Staphylococcus phage phiSA039]|nr:membrane protein [Staphylococcus phage phiSA039]